jgi:general secretion pathway protein G
MKSFMTVDLRFQHGFTIAETLVATALLAIGADAIVGGISGQLERTRVERAKQEIGQIESAIEGYRTRHHELPGSLNDLGSAVPPDPWGHSYEYVNFDASGTLGQRNYAGLPVNSEYDLYSLGPDGRTGADLLSEAGRDDIARARDGSFVGSAPDF